MYAKIFSQIYDGTLCTTGPWQALVTFQQLLILADKEGHVDMTAAAVSRRTTIPLEIIEEGISSLLAPDPESRTTDEDGRRIVPLSVNRNWGWRIVNYKHYRALKREDDRKEYHRNYWNEKRSPKSAQQKTQQLNQKQPIAEAEAEAEAEEETPVANATVGGGEKVENVDRGRQPSIQADDSTRACPHEQIIAIYHRLLPELPRVLVQRWKGTSRSRDLQARWREDSRHQRKSFWEWFFRSVRDNPHWMGVNDRGWKADLGWLLKRANFDKVVERGVNHAS